MRTTLRLTASGLTAPRRTPALAIVASALLLAPGAAVAQSAPTLVQPVRVEAEATRLTRDNARADTLESWAVRYYNVPREWRRAAQYQERSAALRGDDPRAAESWRLAAWLYMGAKDPGYARFMMKHAAEHAAANGNVELAANSYIDAAVLAIGAGREGEAPQLVHKARAVLDSPLLPADRRATILERIVGQVQLAEAWNER
jgi:hypothetical protein